MTTITRFTNERLIAQAEGNITMLRASLEHVKDPFEREDLAADLRLAEIALASLEAEPVAWTEKCEITNMQATGLYLRGFPDNSQGRDIALYTAPPAPVVPPGADAHSARMAVGFNKYAQSGFIEGWNACRAAMLQAGTLTYEDTRQVDELTMWIKRLVRSLKNANPDSKLPRDVMDYLTAKGLIGVGDVLR
ncbi:hypothetical protein [Citrobacter sp. 50677481]|uniref:hypothetical protein n=1 Tax=Citrobacter sp. 50677481 TaxID=1736699 RepID=UPI000A9AB82E|nr:hypothetical protein [Citrobacter sp. 50677481]